jgi:adenylate kinase family enzyme
MNSVFRYAFWKIAGKKTIALVGKSGTGKSFRSKIVAEKYHCQLIIDDGLLIKGDKILAGRSAKRAESMLGAVRTAVFDDEEHRKSVSDAIKAQKYRRILVIGTSEKMAYKICQRLNLEQPEKIIHIEDIATQEEIDAAMRSRYTEGKHVIPVPSIEVTRNYPQIVYDTLRVFFKNKKLPFKQKSEGYEKTIVRPEFSKYGKVSLSEGALRQMLTQSLSDFDNQLVVKNVTATVRTEGYVLTVFLRMPAQHQLPCTISELQSYIADSLENAGSIFVASVSVQIEEWG